MMKKIVLAAGGTGGHVFPAFAVAEVLREEGHDVRWATDRRGLKYESHWQGAKPIVTASASPAGKIKFAAQMSTGVQQALVSFIKNRPDVVVGFGGYPCVPAVVAAQVLGIPTVLHEANATLGLANKVLAKNAKAVALSFNGDTKNAHLTGNPVRPAIARLADLPFEQNEKLNILVFGGSLGAKIFADLMPLVLERMTPEFRASIALTQQVVDEDVKADLENRYKAMGVDATLVPFINDMPDQLAKAHLVIARSGASTVAELTCAGRPAVFIPYPHHGDRQQYANAKFCVDAGGALMLDEKDGLDTVAGALQAFLASRPDLAAMAKSMKLLGKPKAAWTLAALIVKTAG